MKNEDLKKMTDTALADLIQAFEQGKSECLQKYLSTMARFHRYSWGNVLLIAMQKPQATCVAGYQAWLKMNRHVKKGEKGIVIIAPMVVRKKETETETSEDEDHGQLLRSPRSEGRTTSA